MELLQHFSHHHPLTLVCMQPIHDNENINEEDEEDFVIEEDHGAQCNMCYEQIYSFHMCYYECKKCDYSLHKFCAELPTTQQNHPLHLGHILTLSKASQFHEPNPVYSLIEGPDCNWKCFVCNLNIQNFYNYHCSICKLDMDIICATISKQTIVHPSHPHHLQRMTKPMVSYCSACGNEHKGNFFYCTICSWFWIHMYCALHPTKLLIEKATYGTFSHSHPLTLAYSFPYIDKKDKFFPNCRVCGLMFYVHLWIYKCDKCQYYVHVDCATSKREPFMSILLPGGLGKTSKNFKDHEHPNLLHCPFPDESINLLKHHFDNLKGLMVIGNDAEMLNHSSHQHPLVLFRMQTTVTEKMFGLHNPMKKIQLLCDGCVKPITTVPFYNCSQYGQCGFVLHEWCAKLPSELPDYPGHPEHMLFLLPKIPSKFFGVFKCSFCFLPSNGFAYGCTICGYYVDTNCAFIPEEITHEAHPNHLLRKINALDDSSETCNACRYIISVYPRFHCPSCNFNVHIHCALLLPREITHKHDKHPLSLRYNPAENHISEYFCEVCEDEFDPKEWFYHCTTCDQSMHCACAPLILQCEQAVYSRYRDCIFEFLNVKFGGMHQFEGHPHCLKFVQGIKSHGHCIECKKELQYKMIFKCFDCDFALHYKCASTFGG